MAHSGQETTECPSTQPPGGRAQRRHESAGTGVEGEWEEAILEEEAEPRTVQEVSCRRWGSKNKRGDCGRPGLQRVKRMVTVENV